MPRRFRGAAGAGAMLIVLVVMLIAINPEVRRRATLLVGGESEQLRAPARIASGTLEAAGVVLKGYTADNTFLVGFLVVAGLLFILMLRT